jgi:thymidylate synthase (FAD)
MKVINPKVIVPQVNWQGILKSIEYYGRKAYKSEDKITDESAPRFIGDIIGRGHESVIEHEKISVIFICDRGVSHEIVRHRIAAYTQESTRYCNYIHDKFGSMITVIRPFFWRVGSKRYTIWEDSIEYAEDNYMELINSGASPQEARSVLPNSLKTEIAVTYNLREWRHFFTLRCAKDAHPQMRQLAIPLLLYFKSQLGVIFDGIDYDHDFPQEHYAKIEEVSIGD